MNKLALGGLTAFVVASVAFVGVGFAGGPDLADDADASVSEPEVPEQPAGTGASAHRGRSAAVSSGNEGPDAPREGAAEPVDTPTGSLALPPSELPPLPKPSATTTLAPTPSPRAYNPWSATPVAGQARDFVEAVVAEVDAAAGRIESAHTASEAKAILASVDRTIRRHGRTWEAYKKHLSTSEQAQLQRWGQQRITALVARLSKALKRVGVSPLGEPL